jgi:hypothetical protein
MPIVSIIGSQDERGRVSISSLTRLTGSLNIENSESTDLIARLYDKEGKELSSATMKSFEPIENCMCKSQMTKHNPVVRVLHAIIPDNEKAVSIKILRGNETLWVIKRPGKNPSKPKLKVEIQKDGTIICDLKTEVSQHIREIWLQWSSNGKKEPNVLAVLKKSGLYTFSAVGLPPGKGNFQAVNHEQLLKTFSNKVEAEIPITAPTVTIFHPFHHQSLEYGRPMGLHGHALDCFGDPVNPQNCSWYVDKQKVGTGLELFIDVPSPGRHKISLKVKDKTGENSAQSEIMIYNLESLIKSV